MLDEAALPEAPAAAPDEEKRPAGPYQLPEDQLVLKVLEWFKEASDGKGDLPLRREKEWDQLANRQWNEDDAKVVDRQKRPKLTLNLLHTILAAVEGEERTNRQEIKLYGEEQGDDPAAAGLNRLLKWVMNQCGGEFALSQKFRSGIAIGEGWTVPEVDYFEDPEGKIKLVYVDDDEMFPDVLDRSPDGKDARRVQRVRMLTEDEMEARWPDSLAKVRQSVDMPPPGPETDGSGYPDIYLAPNDRKTPKLYDAKKQLWAVLETWWHQIEPGWVVVDEATGLLVEKTEEEFAAMKAEREQAQADWRIRMMTGNLARIPTGRVGFLGRPETVPEPAPKALQASQRPIKCIYQAFTAGKTLLAKSKPGLRDLKRFPYVPFRAIADKVKGEWFGLLRLLIDIQRQHNVEQSVLVHLWQLMPKGGWAGPRGSFHNKHEWHEKSSQPGATLEFNVVRGMKPEPIPQPAVPRHLVELAFSRPNAMREISGVNVEMTGQRQGSDAGVVMEMRKKAAQTVQAPMFDNYRQSKKAVGEVLLAYIQTYVKPNRKIRVLGEEGAQYVEMTEQMQLGRYDLVVEETNSTVNDRMATLNILQTTLPQLMKAEIPIPPNFVDLMPMPPHIRDEWKRMIAWKMTITGQLPPPDWRPGMPIPAPTIPPGAAPAGLPPQPE